MKWKTRCTRPMLTFSDFLATYSLDDDTFGQIIWLTDIPTSGNSPHHLGVSEDGKTLVGGGLLSLLKTQVCIINIIYSLIYLIHLRRILRTILTLATPIDQPSSTATEQYCPRSPMKSGPSQTGKAQPLQAISKKLTFSRGFLITHMGSAAGTSPGRLVETDANYNIINEFPAVTDVAGTLNVVEEPFNPHGLTVDWNKNIILTSDFVVPVSILKPSLGIQHDSTLRLWNLASRTIISTITIPNVSVLQPTSN
jgi:hypothetical protein